MTGAAASVVQERISQQVTAAREQEDGVRRYDPDAIHDMRVALRRLRSALVTFRPLLDRDVTEPLREEVKWLAALLGAVRDTDVMQELLDGLCDSEPEELVLGRVRPRLDERLDDDRRTAREQLEEGMESPRYRALLAALDDLAAKPPWAADKKGAGGKVLRKRVRHDFRRLRDAVHDVDAATTREQRDEHLHEVRKAAKRARYAGETVTPRYGRAAQRFAEAMEEIQSILGDQHDEVIALGRIRDAADDAQTEGYSAFTFGRLHARAYLRADDLVDDFEKAWHDARRKKLRHWLS